MYEESEDALGNQRAGSSYLAFFVYTSCMRGKNMTTYQPRLLLSSAKDDLDNFCTAFEKAGARPQGGYCPTLDLSCDGLVLCGGSDVDTLLYGQERCGAFPPDRNRDLLEIDLFHAFFEAGKPILGICRGMQLINVALGGTLIQDLPSVCLPFHNGTGDNILTHPIRADSDSILCQLYGSVFHVNSLHHQAIDSLGKGMRAIAWAETGFVEAFQHIEHPVIGVQFHPERQSFALRENNTVDGVLLLQYFLTLCRNN